MEEAEYMECASATRKRASECTGHLPDNYGKRHAQEHSDLGDMYGSVLMDDGTVGWWAAGPKCGPKCGRQYLGSLQDGCGLVGHTTIIN
jgi:hypothetical protein